eukprot:262885-Prymnesium_polylepis.1
MSSSRPASVSAPQLWQTLPPGCAPPPASIRPTPPRARERRASWPSASSNDALIPLSHSRASSTRSASHHIR